MTRAFSFFSILFLLPWYGIAQHNEAHIFKYKYGIGDDYTILTNVHQTAYINNQKSHTSVFENKISVKILDTRDGAGLIDAHYRVIEKLEQDSAIRQVTKENRVRYWRDSKGSARVPSDSFVPLVRGIPFFPDQQLTKGDRWSHPAREVFDLRAQYGINTPYPVDILVQYIYLGNKISTIDQREYPAFSIRYQIDHNRRVRSTNGRANVRQVGIQGVSSQEMLWNAEHGRPHSYQDRYRLEFKLTDGRTIRLVGEAHGKVVPVNPMDRVALQRDLEEQLWQLGVQDVSIDTNDDGVRIDLGQLLFLPNVAQLVAGEEEKIAAIATILKDYDHRDKLIVGHTANVGSTRSQNILSQQRAQVVARLLSQYGITNLFTQGLGGSSPLDSNTTPEGRSRNRRVEIIILEN